MESQEKKDDEKVTLILNNTRIKAHKERLAKHSMYFTSLFSENFSDHRKHEYPINYAISMATLKDFVHWAENCKDSDGSKKRNYSVEPCLQKFTNTNDSNPLELLELSVVFMCERLTNDLTSIIILHWLYAEKIIDIWILAQDLGLDKLRDVALGACLDRFEELPFTAVVQLSLENLMKLIGNVNVRSSENWLRFIAKESLRNHRGSGDHDLSNHLYKSLLKIAESGETCSDSANRPTYVSCVVAQKVEDDGEKIPCVYWWKRKQFSELVDLKDIANLMDNGKEVFGRQVIGRGFSIYVIGGEQGLGSGRFNKTIWRYCLLSKTWFSVAELPRPRRHMAVEFLKNKLYLVGGVGHRRLKLSSVDVLDIHTGLWSKAAEVPEMFTEVPASCVINGKLVYHKSNFYIYDPQSDQWDTVKQSPESSINHIDSLIACDGNSCCKDNNIYMSVIDSDLTKCTIFSRLSLDSSHESRPQLIHTWSDQFYRQIFNGFSLVSFSCNNCDVTVEEGTLESINSYQSVRTHTRTIKNIHELGFERRLGCFNVIDPSTLYQQVSFFDQESISV